MASPRRVAATVGAAVAAVRLFQPARALSCAVIHARDITRQGQPDDGEHQRLALLYEPGADQHPRPHPAGDGPRHDGFHRRRSSRRSRTSASPACSASSRPTQPILGYAATGHGAWEAALVNLFSPGDKVLVAESGYFSMNWGLRAEAFGLEVETLANDWRRAVDPAKLEARLREDKDHEIKAVLAVHNETSTGVAHPIAGDAQGDRRRAPPGAVSASTRSRRSARSISAWTNGASTSSSSARRRG